MRFSILNLMAVLSLSAVVVGCGPETPPSADGTGSSTTLPSQGGPMQPAPEGGAMIGPAPSIVSPQPAPTSDTSQAPNLAPSTTEPVTPKGADETPKSDTPKPPDGPQG
jgi:hypothetical protein